MGNDVERKLCKKCSMEIPKAARKCPYCRSYIATFLKFYPAAAILVMILLVGIITEHNPYKQEPSVRYNGEIHIMTQNKVAFGKAVDGETVAVFGVMKNASSTEWRDISLRVTFMDSEGRKIVSGSNDQQLFRMAPNATSSFKISLPKMMSETNYTKYKIEVVRAIDSRSDW